MPLYIESAGIGIIGWSLLVASFGVGTLLLEWVWGTFYDRFDRRLVMILSVLCMIVIYPLFTLQARVPYLAILEFLSGALGVAIGPTTRAFVTEESPSESLGFFTGLLLISSTSGGIIGSLLGAFIAQVSSFKYSFYASTLFSLFTALLIFVTLPKRMRVVGKTKPTTLVGGLKSVLHVRSTGFLFMAALFSTVGATSMRSFLPLYASEQMRMSTLEVGILISATSTAQLIAMLLFGSASDRFGRKRIVMLGLGLSSLTYLFFFIAKSRYELTIVSLAVSVGLSASSLLFSLVPEVAPGRLYGTVVGVYGSFEDAGIVLSPIIYGIIWSSYSPVSIFAAASLTSLLAALVLLPIFQKPITSKLHTLE
jgi:MFS family permease